MFVPKILQHRQRLDWSSVTHVRLKRGAVADTAACQQILEHIRGRGTDEGISRIEDLFEGFPPVRKQLPTLKAMRMDLRHMANLRESGARPENKGLIELGSLVDAEMVHDYPDEIGSHEKIMEGARRQVTVNAFERSRAARESCIRRWGLACTVCGFDFEETYGGRGAGFIHIHHLRPLASIGAEYELNPVEDLRPVCPNCHAMIHRFEPALTLEEVRHLIEDMRQGAAKTIAERDR